MAQRLKFSQGGEFSSILVTLARCRFYKHIFFVNLQYANFLLVGDIEHPMRLSERISVAQSTLKSLYRI